MAGDNNNRRKKPEAAGGGWMATYADMVTLLLCFFVLLLTMADINQKKFRQVTATLSHAFGVQRKDPFHEIPSFNSVVKNEYASAENTLVPMEHPRMVMDLRTVEEQQKDKQRQEKFEKNHALLSESLQEEMEQGFVEIDTDGTNAVVRIREDVSFASGSAYLTPLFEQVAQKLASTLAEADGALEISGHTDDVPIRTPRFRNNWDLSSARAASMATSLMEAGDIPPARFTILGHADTRPRAPNDTAAGRARNRRVEILIRPQVRLPASAEKEAEPQGFDIDQILNSASSAQ